MRRRVTRRGLVLLAVLIVVTISALIATMTMYLADAEREAVVTSLHRTQARALAWSGIQALMVELADQREEMLDGQTPRVTDEWTVYTDENGRSGVVRLVAVGSEGAFGDVLASEGGKLDVNTATVEMLAALPGVSQAIAEAIVQERRNAQFTSVEELVRVTGIDSLVLFGSMGKDAMTTPMDRDGFDAPSEQRRGLAEFVTVFAFDPNIQAGIGQTGQGHRGDRRINLNLEWSEEVGEAIEHRLGPEGAQGVKRLMDEGVKFTSDADIVAQLRRFGTPLEEWPLYLDVFTTTQDPYLIGRVDLTTASAEVLACVPGIDAGAAQEIVSARRHLDEASRRGVPWPVIEGILTEDQFQEAVGHLTTRTLQWRVQIEAGVMAAGGGGEFDDLVFDEDAVRAGVDEFGDGGFEEPALENRVVVEVVIDVASRRPRVAYLRDVTMLPFARAMYASNLERIQEQTRDRTALVDSGDAFMFDDDADAFGDPNLDGVGFGDLDFGLNDGFGSDLDFGNEFDPAADLEMQAAERDEPNDDEAKASSGSSSALGAGRDRRIGRWKTGGTG